VKAAISYSIGNVDCSFGIGGLSVRHSRLTSLFPQYSSRLGRSIGVVHGLFLAYCSCSLNCLGSFVSTASTEPSFRELWLPCRNRRHARSLVSSDYSDALCETIGVTVMLVCLSSAIRVSALAFLLARGRCSHLCSGSDIRRKRVSSTELRPFPSASLHKLSTGHGEIGVMPGDSSTAPNNCFGKRAAPSGVSRTKRLGLSS